MALPGIQMYSENGHSRTHRDMADQDPLGTGANRGVTSSDGAAMMLRDRFARSTWNGAKSPLRRCPQVTRPEAAPWVVPNPSKSFVRSARSALIGDSFVG